MEEDQASEQCKMLPSPKIENPWNVQSIYELQYFNCPTCDFKNPLKQALITHAFELHPEAVEHLSNIDDGSLDDVNCPWTLPKIKSETPPEPENPPETPGEYFEYNINLDYDQEELDLDYNDFIEPLPLPDSFKSEGEEDYKPVLKKPKKKKIKKQNGETTENKEEAVRKHVCNQCPKAFPNPSKLKRHIAQVHEGLRKYQCDECDQTFYDKNNWNDHLNTVHKDEKKYFCDKCDKAFGRLDKLKSHITCVHDRVKNYQCDRCDYKAYDTWKLKRHIGAVHEGVKCEKKHQCEICGRAFAQIYDLRRHISCIHEGIKSYQCDMCDKAFFRLQRYWFL